MLIKYLMVLGVAALPVLELRGAIPYGVAMDLPIPAVLAVSIIGNMIPVPFIIIFMRRILEWMKKKSVRLRNLAMKLEERAKKKGEILVKYELLGLFILVAIPLPGTGAWTGSLIAALFRLRIKYAFPAILGGVIAAGLIMSFLSYGVGWILG